MKADELRRDVLISECSWLNRDFMKGETVYAYHGFTYGCISGDGKAFTSKNGKTPFFELPKSSIKSRGE